MEIIKHLHILGLITHDAVVSSLCFQLILVQPQSLSKKHYYLDSAQATTGLLKIIILILKQFLSILCQLFKFISYEARVRFGTWVRVRVWDLAIFEKGGCGCGGTRRLKNY